MINRLTYTLANEGAFVNFISKDLLEETIGEVCGYEGITDIHGVLLGMRMENFFPIKFLIPIINLKAKQKELLNVFVETLKKKYDLSANWRYILAPIKDNKHREGLYFFNMAKYYSDPRFIEACRKKGIKLLDESMLLKLPREPIKPVELPNDSKHKDYSKRIINQWFETLKRDEYYSTQNLAKDIFNSNLKNDALSTSALAHLIFSIFESYDYFMALDIVEILNPYFIFTEQLVSRDKRDEGLIIERQTLRKYVSYAFSQIMGIRQQPDIKSIQQYIRIQNRLKKLFKNMKIDGLTPHMRSKRVFLPE